MIKTKLAFVLALYIFVVQVVVAGVLWSETRFYLLAGINFFIMLIVAAVFGSKTPANKSLGDVPFVREKSRYSEHPLSSEKKQDADPAPLSESNIEQIKIRINKTKTRAQKQGAGAYRFLVFLCAMFGF